MLTTERYPACHQLPTGRRQVCGAHRRRGSLAMIDRGNEGTPIGQRLLALADDLLRPWMRSGTGRSPVGGSVRTT